MKSKARVSKTKYRDRSAVGPSNLSKPQSHLACPSQNPATPLLRLTCKVSFYCRVNSNNQTAHPRLVQPEQTALHPGLSGSCTRNRINCRKKPRISKQPQLTTSFCFYQQTSFLSCSLISLCSRLYRSNPGYSVFPPSPSEVLLPPSCTNNQKNKWKSINKENSQD